METHNASEMQTEQTSNSPTDQPSEELHPGEQIDPDLEDKLNLAHWQEIGEKLADILEAAEDLPDAIGDRLSDAIKDVLCEAHNEFYGSWAEDTRRNFAYYCINARHEEESPEAEKATKTKFLQWRDLTLEILAQDDDIHPSGIEDLLRVVVKVVVEEWITAAEREPTRENFIEACETAAVWDVQIGD